MIQKIIAKIDKPSEKELLHINGIISLFILAFCGLFLLIYLSDGKELPQKIFFTPIALFVFLSSMVGFASEGHIKKILLIQSPLLLFISIDSYYFLFDLTINGRPKGNFSWSLGFSSFLCLYPIYLFRRIIVFKYISKNMLINYIFVFLLMVTILLDLNIFLNLRNNNDFKKQIEKYEVKQQDIGIGTPITKRPSHTTARTDRVYGDSADQED